MRKLHFWKIKEIAMAGRIWFCIKSLWFQPEINKITVWHILFQHFVFLTVTLRAGPEGPMTPKSALRSCWMTYRKNVSRDSPWNLILDILVVSAQTGNQILKTTFTGSGNRKWKFDFIFLDFLLWEITRSSCVTLSRDRSVKSIPLVLQDQLELWG